MNPYSYKNNLNLIKSKPQSEIDKKIEEKTNQILNSNSWKNIIKDAQKTSNPLKYILTSLKNYE